MASTTQTFRAKPQQLTEHKADDALKARILKGESNSQLVGLLYARAMSPVR